MNKADLKVGMKIKHINSGYIYEVTAVGLDRYLVTQVESETVSDVNYLHQYEPYIEPTKREMVAFEYVSKQGKLLRRVCQALFFK